MFTKHQSFQSVTNIDCINFVSCVSFFEKLGQSIRFNSFHPGILIVIIVLQDYLSVLIEFLYYLFINQVIEDIQNFLTPHRANILFLSKKYQEECTENEPWFQTPYNFSGVYFSK